MIPIKEILTDANFRALLDLIMCSDPWPVQDDGTSQRLIELMATEEAKRRGFDTWVEAYHNLGKVKQP